MDYLGRLLGNRTNASNSIEVLDDALEAVTESIK